MSSGDFFCQMSSAESMIQLSRSKCCLLVNEVSDVAGHLLHLGVVERLDVPHGAIVVCCQEVDGCSLTTKSAASANSVKLVVCI